MNRAAEHVLKEIRTAGTQSAVLSEMQTREELYEYLDYNSYESKLDEMFGDQEQENQQ